MYTSCSWSCLRKKKKCMNDIKQRESLYDISWQVDEPEYRKDPAYSYSTIARFHREGFEGLPKLFDKVESPSLLFGSLVDTLLTGSTEEFDKTFKKGNNHLSFIHKSRDKIVICDTRKR